MATADVTAAKCRGFTLIELMAALAILALLFLLGMPSFITFLRNSEIRSTSESIINGLRTASAEAARRNSRVAFTLGPGADWTIKPTNPADTDCTDLAAEVIQQFAAKEAGKSAKVTITPAAKSGVCFTGLGRIYNPGANDHIRQIDIGPTVAGAEGRPLRIIVDDPAPADPAKPRGLRMCDPDPALTSLTPPDPRAC
jgi:type IV fimbrial biogenesis protein FimT